MTAADQWAHWRAALAAVLSGEPVPAIDANAPASGFYESRSKNRQTGEITRGLIAFWRDDAGKLFCKAGYGERARMLDEAKACDQWPYVAKRPISRETYDAVRTGKGWPDEHPAAAADRAATSDGTARPNNAPEPDSLEGVAERLADLGREAEKAIGAGAAKTKDAADQAADLADRLLKLEKTSDTKRRDGMRPHEEEADKVDKLWRPLRDKAADLKSRLKAVVVTPFLLAARDAAIRQATAEAAASGDTISDRAIAARSAPAGSTSRTSLRDNKSARITDYPKALAYFAENDKVKALVQQLATASVRAGTMPDGCKLHTTASAA